MKRISLSLLTILFTLILLMNCAQSNNHSRRPVTSIQCEPKRKNYKMGEVFQVNFNTKLKDGALNKIEISVDGKLVITSKNLTNTLSFKTSDFGVGKHILKISALKSDGILGDNYEEILVTSDVQPVKYTYQIVATYPHNITHFTQGLEFHDNMLYEGTGLEGSSCIYRLDLKTSKVLKEYKLENQYFGEGITILNNKIYELTYKNDIGFVYDINTFKILNTWKYKSKEGWGLTNDGTSLIMSDGTENLYFIHPENFQEIKKIQVCNEHSVVKNLNELEYIKGEIWANIWTTDNLVIIDPKTGKVTGEVNLSGLNGSILQNQNDQIDVLNGIAWNPVTDKIYVTGKLWPKLFEIKLIKK
ncbi:MAG TPA: glutaminyl-peptide cyclotransferase [Prolixibacteraceae bacterium]